MVHSDGLSNAVCCSSKSIESIQQNDAIESTQQPQPEIVEVDLDDQLSNDLTNNEPFLRIKLKEKARNNSAILNKKLPLMIKTRFY